MWCLKSQLLVIAQTETANAKWGPTATHRSRQQTTDQKWRAIIIIPLLLLLPRGGCENEGTGNVQQSLSVGGLYQNIKVKFNCFVGESCTQVVAVQSVTICDGGGGGTILID